MSPPLQPFTMVPKHRRSILAHLLSKRNSKADDSDAATGSDSGMSVKPSPAPPPYDTVRPTFGLLGSKVPSTVAINAERHRSNTNAIPPRTPLCDCEDLLLQLKDVSLCLKDRGKVLDQSRHSIASGSFSGGYYKTVDYQSIGGHIESIAQDARNLEQEMLRARQVNGRIDVTSIPSIDEHAMCAFMTQGAKKIETWLNGIDEYLLEMNIGDERSLRKKIDALNGERYRLDQLCLLMSAKCSVLCTGLQKRRLLPASECGTEARNSEPV